MAIEFEKGVDKISQEVSKAAENMKETASDLWGWWKKSSIEEKISTILGIILLVLGLYGLFDIVLPVILVTVGILLVTGYFDKPIKSVINWFKSNCKSTRAKKEDKEPLEKVDVEKN